MLPQNDPFPVDLSFGNIRLQIAAELLEIRNGHNGERIGNCHRSFANDSIADLLRSPLPQNGCPKCT